MNEIAGLHGNAANSPFAPQRTLHMPDNTYAMVSARR